MLRNGWLGLALCLTAAGASAAEGFRYIGPEEIRRDQSDAPPSVPGTLVKGSFDKSNAVPSADVPGQRLLSAPYVCADPIAVDSCRLPGSAEIREEIEIFDAQSQGQAERIQGAMGGFASKAAEVEALAGSGPGSVFTAFYLESARRIREASRAPRVAEDLEMVGPSSALRKQLEDLRVLVERFESKIGAATDPDVVTALKISRNIKALGRRSGLEGLVRRRAALAYHYDLNSVMSSMTFDASSLVLFEDSCGWEAKEPLKRVYISREARDATYGGVNALRLIDDAPILRKALEGTASRKGPLTFSCPSSFFGTGKARYDARTHTLTNPFKRSGNNFGGYLTIYAADTGAVLDLIREGLKD